MKNFFYSTFTKFQHANHFITKSLQNTLSHKLGFAVIVILQVIIAKSCLFQSMHPLFTKDESVFDESLIGKWLSIDKQNTWEFEKFNSDDYDTNQLKLSWISIPVSTSMVDSVWTYDTLKPVVMTFKVRIGMIKHQLYMDLYPIHLNRDEDNGNYEFHLPMHTFAKLDIKNDTLTEAFINYNWLEKGIEKKKFKIKHEKIEDDGIVLTASTKELKRFITKFSNSKEAFDSPLVLIKQK